MMVDRKPVQPPQPEVSHMTRSGRIYAANDLPKNQEPKKSELPPKKAVTEEEAKEFLKLLKKSEYKVIEQLS